MFQKNIVEKYLSKLDRKILEEKYNQFCAIFQNEKKIENIRNSKEEQYQEGFIRDLFVSVLGYTIKTVMPVLVELEACRNGIA